MVLIVLESFPGHSAQG